MIKTAGIKTDEELVAEIDELKFRLKGGLPYSPMREDFNQLLNAFIAKWGLDTDPGMFATLPATPANAEHDAKKKAALEFLRLRAHDTVQKIVDIDPAPGVSMTITCPNTNRELRGRALTESQPKLKEVGFWKTAPKSDRERRYFGETIEDSNNAKYPDVRDFVDPDWQRDHFEEYTTVMQYVVTGQRHATYRGFSMCRICQQRNGSTEFTDGTWAWPEGFAHYIAVHSVKPPQEFIDYVMEKKTP